MGACYKLLQRVIHQCVYVGPYRAMDFAEWWAGEGRRDGCRLEDGLGEAFDRDKVSGRHLVELLEIATHHQVDLVDGNLVEVLRWVRGVVARQEHVNLLSWSQHAGKDTRKAHEHVCLSFGRLSRSGFCDLDGDRIGGDFYSARCGHRRFGRARCSRGCCCLPTSTVISELFLKGCFKKKIRTWPFGDERAAPRL